MRRFAAVLAALVLSTAGLVLTAPNAHAVAELTVGQTYAASVDTGMCSGQLRKITNLFRQGVHYLNGYQFRQADGKPCASLVKTTAQWSKTYLVMRVTMSTVSTTERNISTNGSTGYTGPAVGLSSTSAAYRTVAFYWQWPNGASGSVTGISVGAPGTQAGTNYHAASPSTGGCSGHMVGGHHFNDRSTPSSALQFSGRVDLYYNQGLNEDARDGKPGWCISGKGTGTAYPTAWINLSTNSPQHVRDPEGRYRYRAYPEGQTSAASGTTPGVWIDTPTDHNDPNLCVNYGGTVIGHLSGSKLTAGVDASGKVVGLTSPAGCTVRDYPWDTDPSFHPPTNAYEQCMGYPQVGVPMRNHAEQYVNKLVLYYTPALYPPGYTGPLKEGEFCAAVVPAEGYENATTSGIQVRMTLSTNSGIDRSVERASSGTRVAVNSPPDLYPLGGANCITVEGWSRMFSATENAIYDFFEFCGPLDKLPQPYNPHQLEERVAELYGNVSEDCIQIFGRYMFFDSVWQGSCDGGTFVAVTDPVPGAGTWAADHPITLDLRCNRLTPDVNESRTVEAHVDGGTSWNFNGYRCAPPIFGTAAEHSTKIWIHPRATYPQLNPNEIRFGT